MAVTLITILIVICSILLAGIILIQNPKEGGLSSGFSAGNQIGGVQKTADFLEKATWTLAIAIVVLCLLTSVFKSDNKIDSSINTELPIN